MTTQLTHKVFISRIWEAIIWAAAFLTVFAWQNPDNFFTRGGLVVILILGLPIAVFYGFSEYKWAERVARRPGIKATKSELLTLIYFVALILFVNRDHLPERLHESIIYFGLLRALQLSWMNRSASTKG